MQLPRGTFREIKRGIRVFDLIEEVERIGFSGLCTISYGTENVTLVFRSGKCILADFLGRHGDSAWEELRKADDQEIDAALSTLDEAQIQLSLEFNKSSRILKAARPAGPAASARGAAPARTPLADAGKRPAAHHPPASPAHPAKSLPKHGIPPAPSPAPEHARVRPAEPPSQHKPSISERLPPVPAPSPARETPRPQAAGLSALQKHVIPGKPPAAEVPPVEKRRAEEYDAPESADTGAVAEAELDSFDTMDLENVADKIRSDCKTMIKHLHLEHLMER